LANAAADGAPAHRGERVTIRIDGDQVADVGPDATVAL
jgi:hypothetical protein